MEIDHYPAEDLPEDFDVEEALNDYDEENDIVDGGPVEVWESQELSEKVGARPYITGVKVSVWAISVIASALRLLLTGDFLLTVPPALISVPLYTVLKFYYESG